MARILVIEDHPANLELMVYLLEAFGHTVLSEADGEAGIESARRARPDLIVCDVHLPKVDGYGVARELKGDPAARAFPLLAVTALAMVGDREHILAAGFDGYISKPIVPETFVAQVESFLAPAQRAAPTPAAAIDSAPEMAAPLAPTRATILIVDDSPVNQELMRSVLEPFGYAVVTAGGVSEALVLAREHSPALIVSDLHMPGQTGFDLIRAIKADAQLGYITIIMHSATIRSEAERREAIRLGAAKFLAGPLEPQIILAEIEACLYQPPERQDGDHSHP